ncbi:MAG: LptF/LptG family permease [Nitratireductor sp.]|nr:LptF/LptG family permease [Nitratireductor sp.]MCC0019523.1 LptF/LptG family permease [Nitratireductor sp.]
MKLIERYIFSKAATGFLLTLLALGGVVWIIQIFQQIDLAASSGRSLIAYLQITGLAIPALFFAVIPIALMLSVASTVNQLNNNSELVVLSAAGASNRIIAKPFIVLALICTLFVGAVAHFIMPISLKEMKGQASRMKADLLSLIVREGVFTAIEKGMVVHVARRNDDGSLGGVLLYDSRDPKESWIYFARRGVVSQANGRSALLLQDGEIQLDQSTTQPPTTVKFQNYVIDLDTMTPEETEKKYRRPMERTTPALFNIDPEDSYYRRKPDEFDIQIHVRFSEMLWPLANVLVLLAFAGQARSSRQGATNAIFWAAVLLLILRGIAFSAQNSAKGDLIQLVWLYVIPVAAILAASYYLWRNRVVTMPEWLRPHADRLAIYMENDFNRRKEAYIAWRRRISREGLFSRRAG